MKLVTIEKGPRAVSLPVVRLNELAVCVEELGQVLDGALHPSSCHAEPQLLQIGRGSLVGTSIIVTLVS